jgi:hypothetical protein
VAPIPAGGDYGASREALGDEWGLLEAWAKAPLNPSRSGAFVSESTWGGRYEPCMLRLMGYATAMGKGEIQVAELLADGGVLLDYALFITEHRRALSRGRHRNHGRSNRRRRRGARREAQCMR